MGNRQVLVIDDATERLEKIQEFHRTERDQCTLIKQCDTACVAVLDGEWDIIYIDHDAGFWKKVYFDNYRPVAVVVAAKYGHRAALAQPEVRIQSSNPSGAKWLVDYLVSHGMEKCGYFNANQPELGITRVFASTPFVL